VEGASPPRYADSYLNPASYRILVDAFPGMWLQPKGDQVARPHQPPPKDVWHLRVPENSTGFEFTLTGERERPRVGPPHPVVSLTAQTVLSSSTAYSPNDSPAPWLHHFSVPGPGLYHVSAAITSAAGVGRPQTGTLELRDLLVVSIGDSAASGEGNPDRPGRPKGFDPDLGWIDVVPPIGFYTLSKALLDSLRNYAKKKLTTLNRARDWGLEMDPEPVWLERRAHRSLLSGHARTARMVEEARLGTVVTFLPFGRSGAKILQGLVDESRGSEDSFLFGLPEVNEVARTVGKRRIEALLIYIGINDIGISNILGDLTQGDLGIPFIGGDDAANREAVKKNAKHVIDVDFPVNFKHLKQEIQDNLNVRHVYLCEYPSGLWDSAVAVPSAGCGLFQSGFDLDISPADARALQDINNWMNDGLKQAAHDNGWFFVTNIANRFRGRGYCTDAWVERAFIQAEESLGYQGDTEGSVHPNGRGHEIIAEEIVHLLLANTVDDPVTMSHRPSVDPAQRTH
jgi:hypothetical protein